uniref:lebercilin-like protein n=1 Tax=Oncorhynchus gorbuscha TaxID=8017 RepID=UPI001EAF1896|nr:lebercilin-like protein [Oncorhynchus gorbuscha]
MGDMSLSLRHHTRGIVQQDNANYEVGAGDVDSSCSSGQSTPSRSSRGYSSTTGSRVDSQGSCTQSDYEEEADTTANRTFALSTNKKPGLGTKTAKTRTQNKGGQWCKKKKNTNLRNRKASLVPPIKPLEGPNQRIRSAHRHRIKELNSQVWELQQQLSGVATENKLLKQLQVRHTVALQRFQDSQSGLPQVLAKHGNEVRGLQELLRKARIRRNSLSRRLRGTEEELLRTKDVLHRLQLLSEDRSLKEREELSHRLALISVDLNRKNKRIQDLERNFELSQISFNRHLATETRKTNEAREMSDYLQAQISLLTQKIKEKERELEIHNIYSHRFPNGWNGKGARETKSVQTDDLSSLPIEAPCQLELEYACSLQHLELEKQKSLSWESFAIDFTDRSDAADTLVDDRGSNNNEDFAEDGELDGDSDKENPQLQGEEDCLAEKAASSPNASGEQTEPFESQVRYTLEDFLNTERANKALESSPRTKRLYKFKETIQNLHSGKPAYTSHTHSLRKSPPRYIKSQARVENLGSGAYEPSFVTLPAEKLQRRDTRGPQPEDGVVRSKKSSLMKELFGQAPITDPIAMQTGRSRVQSTDLDRMSSHHTGDASPVSPGRETKIIFD